MKRIFLLLLALCLLSTQAYAFGLYAISQDGNNVAADTLANAATRSDLVGYSIHFSLQQTVTTAISWPSDRKLVQDPGGSIVFSGAGALTGLPYAEPEWFGAKGDNSNNDTTGWVKALAAAAKVQGRPGANYIINNISLPSNRVIDLNGSTLIYNSGQTGAMLSAVTQSNIVIKNGTLEGGTTLAYDNTINAPTLDRSAVLVQTNSTGIRLEHMNINHFANAGLSIDHVGNSAPWGNAVHVVDTVFNDNYVSVIHNTRGEYCFYSNCEAINSRIGVQIGAGNVHWSGGSVSGNIDGVVLLSGDNDGHGVMSGTAINHNASWNIRTDGPANGFTFNGCNIYSGLVDLKNATGVKILNGQLGATIIYAEAGGYNLVANNFKNGTWTVVHGANSTTSYLQLRNNYDLGGGLDANFPAAYIDMTAITANAGVTGASIIKYITPNLRYLFSLDTPALYDTTTGYAAIPIDQKNVTINASFSLDVPGGSPAIAGGYILVGSTVVARQARYMAGSSTANAVNLSWTGLVGKNTAISVWAISNGVATNLTTTNPKLLIQTID